jgi:hypothetical protein
MSFQTDIKSADDFKKEVLDIPGTLQGQRAANNLHAEEPLAARMLETRVAWQREQRLEAIVLSPLLLVQWSSATTGGQGRARQSLPPSNASSTTRVTSLSSSSL